MDYNTDENGFAVKPHVYSVDTKSTDNRTDQQSDNTVQPAKCSDIDRESGLCHLLSMQLIFGVTYCGNCPYSKNNMIRKTMYIIYDCVVIISFALFECYGFSDDVFTRIFYTTKNKGIMKVLFRLAGLSMAIEFFAIKGMLLKNGWNLIRTIRTSGNITNNNIMIFKYNM